LFYQGLIAELAECPGITGAAYESPRNGMNGSVTQDAYAVARF